MSGIFGIVRPPGARVSAAELAPMAEVLKHRGPDGIHSFARDNVGLGHCLLRSTPEARRDTLPLHDGHSGLTITADARIDNREELQHKLSRRAEGSEVITDSQLILAAYRRWNEACVDHLLGDFAFAIWDQRARALFVARDPLGCKPLYYHCRNGLFVFASSAMAVARVPAVGATLNEGRVADYRVEELEGINKTCTWYNEISRLPPAQCGYFRDACFRVKQYWQLRPVDLSHLNSDEDYLEAFTEVYAEAVRCRLRCSTEPASMLSGALARDMLAADNAAPLRTFSAVSEAGADCAETRSVEAVLKGGRLRASILRPGDVSHSASALFTAIGKSEDPFDTEWTLLVLMFLGAAQAGGRAMLTGLDGEHAVGAPSNYISGILEGGSWRQAWRESKGFSRHYYRGACSPSAIFFKALRSRMTPEGLRRLRRKLATHRHCRQLLAQAALPAGLARRADLPSRLREYELGRYFATNAGIQDWHQHVIQVPYLTAAVERYERLASYCGVEARHPLLDVRLLQVSNALPLAQKVRDGWSKYLLRSLADQRLPAAVAWREGWEEIGWKFNVTLMDMLASSSASAATCAGRSWKSYFPAAPGHSQSAGTPRYDPGVRQSWREFQLDNWLSRANFHLAE